MSFGTASIRRVPTAFAAVAAALAVALALLLAGGNAARAGAVQTPSLTKVVAFHEAMDKLWTDHVTWTRLVIVDFDANAPDLKPDLGDEDPSLVGRQHVLDPRRSASRGSACSALTADSASRLSSSQPAASDGTSRSSQRRFRRTTHAS